MAFCRDAIAQRLSADPIGAIVIVLLVTFAGHVIGRVATVAARRLAR